MEDTIETKKAEVTPEMQKEKLTAIFKELDKALEDAMNTGTGFILVLPDGTVRCAHYTEVYLTSKIKMNIQL